MGNGSNRCAGGVLVFVAGVLIALADPLLAQDLEDSPDTQRESNRAFAEEPLVAACSFATSGKTARSWLFGADLGANDGSSSLFRLNTDTGALCSLGEIGIDDIFDVAFLPDGRLFGIKSQFFSSTLVEINPRTGSYTTVGTGIGFNAVNGLLANGSSTFLASTSDGELIKISAVTGAGTFIGSFGSGYRSVGDLALSPDGRLLMVGCDGFFTCTPTLVEVDQGTGMVTPKPNPVGFDDVFGLAFEPMVVLEPATSGQPTRIASGPRLIGVANGGRFEQPLLIEIDIDSGVGNLIASLDTFDGMGGLAANIRMPPVWGPFSVTDDRNSNCRNLPSRWTHCQHMTGFHTPGSTADDTYAWDANLRFAGHPEPFNADRGKPVFPLGAGKVVKKAGTIATGGTFGQVHLQHAEPGVDCGASPQDCSWSGYLHLTDIRVSEGDSVGLNTLLGFVGDAGATNDHLHFVMYEGANVAGSLESVDLAFECLPAPARTLPSMTITNTAELYARRRLITGSEFVVASEAEAFLFGADSVVLQDGLIVHVGGVLTVEADIVPGCP